jgi:hypothetical protein
VFSSASVGSRVVVARSKKVCKPRVVSRPKLASLMEERFEVRLANNQTLSMSILRCFEESSSVRRVSFLVKGGQIIFTISKAEIDLLRQAIQNDEKREGVEWIHAALLPTIGEVEVGLPLFDGQKMLVSQQQEARGVVGGVCIPVIPASPIAFTPSLPPPVSVSVSDPTPSGYLLPFATISPALSQALSHDPPCSYSQLRELPLSRDELLCVIVREVHARHRANR